MSELFTKEHLARVNAAQRQADLEADSKMLDWLQKQGVDSHAVPGTTWWHLHGWSGSIRQVIAVRMKEESEAA